MMRRALFGLVVLAACSEPADTRLMSRDAGFEPVEVEPLAFVTVELPVGRLGEAYEVAIEGDGGRPPYTWRIVTGDPPLGVEFEEGTPSATLAGAPRRVGSFTFAVDLRDADGALVTQLFELVVIDEAEPLEILTIELPPGMQAERYEADIACTPGLGPYDWRVRTGALPPRMSLTGDDAIATIAGTPQSRGTSNFTLEVRDRYDRVAQRAFSLVIHQLPPVRIVEPEQLPPGRVGVPYDTPITAADGAAPYAWTSAPSLPVGLTLAPGGTPATRLYGTPEERGLFTFEVAVEDAIGNQATRPYELEILPGALAIRTSTVPDGALCEDYIATLEVEGGTPPYSWNILQGSLPPGLLSDSAGARVAVIGVPQQAGTFSIDAVVIDADGATLSTSLPVRIGPIDGPRFGVLIGAQLPQRRVWPIDLCAAIPAPMGSLSMTSVSEVGVAGGTQSFALSPTRTHFVYTAEQSGQRGIFLVDLTGVAPVQTFVTEVAAVADVAVEWSPDGTWLAFRARLLSQTAPQLYVVDITATPFVSRQIDPPSSGSAGPTTFMRWSPNGRRLAFIGTHTQLGEAYVTEVSTATVTTRVVSRGPVGPAEVVRLVAWTPDSNHLLFSAQRVRGARREIYSVDVRSPTATPEPIAPSAVDASNVSLGAEVSASGDFFAYLGDQQVIGRSDLYVVDLTATPYTVVRAASSTSPIYESVALKWAPVGDQLAFIARQVANGPYGLYELDPHVATAATRIDPPSTVDGGVAVSALAFAFNHDGSRLAYVADTYTRGRYQHYVAHRAGPHRGMIFPIGQLDATHRTVIFEWAARANRMLIAAEPRTGGAAELFVADLDASRGGTTTRVGAPTSNVYALAPALAISATGARIFSGEITASAPSPTPSVTYTAGPLRTMPTLLTPAAAQLLHQITN